MRAFKVTSFLRIFNMTVHFIRHNVRTRVHTYVCNTNYTSWDILICIQRGGLHSITHYIILYDNVNNHMATIYRRNSRLSFFSKNTHEYYTLYMLRIIRYPEYADSAVIIFRAENSSQQERNFLPCLRWFQKVFFPLNY